MIKPLSKIHAEHSIRRMQQDLIFDSEVSQLVSKNASNKYLRSSTESGPTSPMPHKFRRDGMPVPHIRKDITSNRITMKLH
jgi:hypothetical protein